MEDVRHPQPQLAQCLQITRLNYPNYGMSKYAASLDQALLLCEIIDIYTSSSARVVCAAAI